ncbi:deoxyribose-phosphate aldolase [Natrarchaeobius halalkaliphilus]|uniref:Deoxyribose-phosphate aldolase n=1 Tax=Natrarchaeobius halalkaliphilus TaxID=1679091 RepID=A0A3N6N0G7_9EURY|nr:deoxyribose-phosphate aldolase [Natrarchaeobius halalkaliphilus]RQG91392.1 deoxyribose-phosphate aldolase [Natrarchaeobius halalkaliphilus]
MERNELAPLIDHTVLGPETTPTDVRSVLEDARAFGMNACIPPYALEDATSDASDVTIATVIGFPHGQNDHDVKRREGVLAWKAGADELDVVINVGRLKAGEDDAVRAELAEVVAAVPVPVKVIVETALLTEAETERACEAAVAADAAMVKTSTGFADAGATLADVELMSGYLPVKASGGIGSYEEALAMLEAGAERIGTSSGVEILEGAPSRQS